VNQQINSIALTLGERIFYFIAACLWVVVCPTARSMPANGDFELGSTTYWSVWNPANQPFQWGTTGNGAT
jgi:hypothetical protein